MKPPAPIMDPLTTTIVHFLYNIKEHSFFLFGKRESNQREINFGKVESEIEFTFEQKLETFVISGEHLQGGNIS